jgi:hypothetical protein
VRLTVESSLLQPWAAYHPLQKALRRLLTRAVPWGEGCARDAQKMTSLGKLRSRCGAKFNREEVNTVQPLPTPTTADPNRPLEEACVEEYLRAHGYTQESVRRLPADAARSIMTSANRAAGQRLTEIECRAHWLRGVHRH